MVNIPKDFKEFIQLLNEHRVRYLIVGGYAVAYHGYPRSTGDIDIFIDTEAENANVLLEALNEFGFGGLGLSADDFTVSDQVIQLGYPPLRIDLLTSIDGVSFGEAWNNRNEYTDGHLTLQIISREDLVKNKLSTGRHRDLADAEEL
ncbi:MAG: hypothetical protein K9L21_03135 [Spirochaetia bacterium]|jgi:hypothetical protein|nr:hypothetical protein [Spirochaetia bacterium]